MLHHIAIRTPSVVLRYIRKIDSEVEAGFVYNLFGDLKSPGKPFVKHLYLTRSGVAYLHIPIPIMRKNYSSIQQLDSLAHFPRQFCPAESTSRAKQRNLEKTKHASHATG